MSDNKLISEEALSDLQKSDARRAKLQKDDPQSRKFWNNFARSIETDLQLVLEGKSADVIETAEGPIVVKRLSEKYPVRSRWLKFKNFVWRILRKCGFKRPLFKVRSK